jgi:hypothetical protein
MRLRRKSDALLEGPLLTDSEVESFLKDLRALQKGEITSFVNSDFWQLMTAEMRRREVNAQIEMSRSLSRSTWVLAIATVVLVIVTAIALLGHASG